VAPPTARDGNNQTVHDFCFGAYVYSVELES